MGCPAPTWRFHLLRLHTGLPSSQLWELAFRTSSDPAGCAFVTAALQLVLVLRLVPAFSFHPSAVVYPWELTSCVFIAPYFMFQHYLKKKKVNVWCHLSWENEFSLVLLSKLENWMFHGFP